MLKLFYTLLTYLYFRYSVCYNDCCFAKNDFQELIRYAGCKDMDEFLAYSGHSFRGLIRPDEQALVEKSIWDQIHSKANGPNDYVQFHFVKKDGSCHPVLDHGRIVENTYFGTIFYVLIMDCALLDTHYNN